MSQMNVIKGGFLGKSAGYYYYIQNITLNKTGWLTAKLKYNNKISEIYKNYNTDVSFEMKQDNQYNIILKVNNKDIFIDKQLFDYELEIELEPNSNETPYVISEGLIVDH